MKKLLLMIFISLTLTSCAHHSEPQASEQPLALNNPQLWQANTNTIWNKLQREPLTTLTSEQQANTKNSVANGWLKLAIINKSYNNNTQQLTQALANWRKEFPNHPANALFANDNTLNTLNTQTNPKHIAVLLPLGGMYGDKGENVRNGIMSAASADSEKPQISFYDTEKNPDIQALYQKAIKEGATFVIGPLVKNNVRDLLRQSNFPVPTLALNYTQPPLPNNFYEFGLAPQDETAQLVEKARQSGFNRVLIIAPQNTWGHNIAQNITSQWQTAGGSVADTYYFVSNNSNLSDDIAKVLHAKADDLSHTQHRQDIDVIFLLAQPENARQIAPLLKYHGMSNTPIYSTSVIYSGTPSNRDNDLNGISFIDAPLTLQKNNNRLYAVGRDAYYISQHLPRMVQLNNFPVYGGTGALTLSSNQQIHRRLPWVTMHDGHP